MKHDRALGHVLGIVERETLILPGCFATTASQKEALITVLGSCVAVCLYDPERKLGGMNHLALPEDAGLGARGSSAMEGLFQALIGQGGRAGRMQAKLFGGAGLRQGLPDIGVQTLDFAVRFLERNGVRVAAKDVGGHAARRLIFHPVSGRAWVRRNRNAALVDHVEVGA